MIIVQDYLACLSQASYLVADEVSRVAAVVDPRRDVDGYLEAARARGLTIRYAILTHLHADFVAGHLELAARAGAEVCLGAAARVDFPFRALRDGERIELGPRVRLEVLETPGHTPESIPLVVRDIADAAAPLSVLTGDTLFVGDVGRPDLLASVGAAPDALARMLHRSLQGKLLTLPDETVVYPGHGAGSSCGKSLGPELTTTIGAQRRANPSLAPMSEDAFARMVTTGQPDAPAYFAWDVHQNRSSRPTLDRALAALAPLSLDDALRRQRDGAQVLDAREADDFARDHLPGALNVGLDGRFAQWAGVVLDPRRPVLLVAPPGQEAEVATRLGRIGFDGALAGHLAASACGGATIERLAPRELERRLAGPSPPLVLDARSEREREDDGRIAGSVGIPLPQLAARLGELPRDRRIVVHCAGGYRSMVAASVLARAGFDGVGDLDGGIGAWEESGLPTS